MALSTDFSGYFPRENAGSLPKRQHFETGVGSVLRVAYTRKHDMLGEEFPRRLVLTFGSLSVNFFDIPRLARQSLKRGKSWLQDYGPKWGYSLMLAWGIGGILILLFTIWSCQYRPIPGWDWAIQGMVRLYRAAGVHEGEPKCLDLSAWWQGETSTTEASPTVIPEVTAPRRAPVSPTMAPANPAPMVDPNPVDVIRREREYTPASVEKRLPRTAEGGGSSYLWPLATIGVVLLSSGLFACTLAVKNT